MTTMAKTNKEARNRTAKMAVLLSLPSLRRVVILHRLALVSG